MHIRCIHSLPAPLVVLYYSDYCVRPSVRARYFCLSASIDRKKEGRRERRKGGRKEGIPSPFFSWTRSVIHVRDAILRTSLLLLLQLLGRILERDKGESCLRLASCWFQSCKEGRRKNTGRSATNRRRRKGLSSSHSFRSVSPLSPPMNQIQIQI